MSDSVAAKAAGLDVYIEKVSVNEMSATVVVKEQRKVKGKRGRLVDQVDEHTQDVIIRRDGSYTCTCKNFMYSKASHLDLWRDNTRVKPECKHALAVKLHDTYKAWIRMILVPVADGYVLRSIENVEQIHVKSMDEKFSWMPRVKKLPPRYATNKIPFDKIFKPATPPGDPVKG
jgi:hypothetical protein